MRHRVFFCRFIAVALLAMIGSAFSASAGIIQLGGVSNFTSTVVETFDFDSSMSNLTNSTFAAGGQIPTNSNQLSRSGLTFYGSTTDPLIVNFNVDAYEVGFYFGNDHFLYFGQVDYYIDAYDSADNYLGTVSMTGNGDDRINQFLGLRSDDVLGYIAIRNTASSFNPGIVIDDYSVGYEPSSDPVPEPASLTLLGLGLLGLAVKSRRKE